MILTTNKDTIRDIKAKTARVLYEIPKNNFEVIPNIKDNLEILDSDISKTPIEITVVDIKEQTVICGVYINIEDI